MSRLALGLMLLLLAAAGCQRDLCSAFADQACVDLALATNAGEIAPTRLEFLISSSATGVQSQEARPRESLAKIPARIAIVFDALTETTALTLEALAEREGAASLSGSTTLTLRPREHAHATILLGGAGLGDGGGDAMNGGDLGGADALPSTDMALEPCEQGMVPISKPAGGRFCIDKHEVRRDEYEQFLLDGIVPMGLPAACAGYGLTEPTCEWPATPATRALPVTCVSWCDAAAYCKSYNKRLCGAIDGVTPLTPSERADPARDEWYRACSKDGARMYPYGASYSPTVCGTSSTAPHDVGTLMTCEGGYAGLFDMSGNAAEWEDSCTNTQCLVRGGSFFDSGGVTSCGYSLTTLLAREYRGSAVGFRCCR